MASIEILPPRLPLDPLPAPPAAPARGPSPREAFDHHLQRAQHPQSAEPAAKAPPRPATSEDPREAAPAAARSETEAAPAEEKPTQDLETGQNAEQETGDEAGTNLPGENQPEATSEAEASAEQPVDLLQLSPAVPPQEGEQETGAKEASDDAKAENEKPLLSDLHSQRVGRRASQKNGAQQEPTGNAQQAQSEQNRAQTGAAEQPEPTVAEDGATDAAQRVGRAKSQQQESATEQKVVADEHQDQTKNQAAEPTDARNTTSVQSEPTEAIAALEKPAVAASQAGLAQTAGEAADAPRRRGRSQERSPDATPAVASGEQIVRAEFGGQGSTVVTTDAVAGEAATDQVPESLSSARDARGEASEVDTKPRTAENHDPRANASGRFSLARHAGETSDARHADGLTHAERVRFVQRVANAFQTATERGGELRLRLAPPELGPMRLEVQMERGVLTARVEVETPAARNALLDNLPLLRERLAGQEIKIGSFDIDLMDQPQQGPHDQARYDSDGSQHQRRPHSGNRPAREAEPAGPTSSAAPRRPLGGSEQSLNILI